MVYRTLIKDHKVVIASIAIEEPKQFIDKIREEYNAIIQIIDIDTVLDVEYLEEILKLVLEAYERCIMVSRHIETEILLRIASTNQIYKAIEFAGAKPNKLAVFVALSRDKSNIDRLIEDLELKDINFSRYDKLLEYHNIADIELDKRYLIEKANLIY